jgi:hypothetical protein
VTVEAIIWVADEVLARIVRRDPAGPGRAVYGMMFAYEVEPPEEPLVEPFT